MGTTLEREFSPGKVTTGWQQQPDVPDQMGSGLSVPQPPSPVTRPTFISAFLQNLPTSLGAAAGQSDFGKGLSASLQAMEENKRYQTQQQQQSVLQSAQLADTKSQTNLRNAQAYKAINDEQKKPTYQYKLIAGPNGDPQPAAWSAETGFIDPVTQQPIPNATPYEKKPADKPLSEFDTFYSQYLKDNKLPDNHVNKLKAHQDWTTNPQTAGNADNTRLDKSYEYNSNKLSEAQKPVAAYAERLGRLGDAINQKTPAADALIAPELVTIMAGGQGTGVRVNEPEISRVVGGRSNWESLQAAVNKWRSDPSKALSITDSQRGQIKSLFDLVQSKVQQKQQVLDDAGQSLVEAGDVKKHRQIVTDAKKNLMQIDLGMKKASVPPPPPGFVIQ